MPLLRLLANLVRLPIFGLLWLIGRARPGRSRWVRVHLTERLSALHVRAPRLQRWFRRQRPTVALDRLDALVRHAEHDPSIDGVIVHVPRLSVGWAAAGHLRSCLERLGESGKRVVVHLPQGAGDREAFVASSAATVVMSPQASVSLLGFAAGGLYFGQLLSRLGLAAQVMAQGDFKTAAERLASDRMSAAEEEQLGAILRARQGLLEQALATRLGPGQQPATLFDAVAFHGARAVESGLVDVLAYEDALPKQLGIDAGAAKRLIVPGPAYLGRAERRAWRPLRQEPYLAVVPVHGMIQQGGGFPPLGGRAVTALEPTVSILRRVRADPHAVGVLLHVDSPGGSALVSDLIHHEVEGLAREKPLVAYFADVAASGGYYVAAPAKRIVAAPQTITGSIGVISLKLVADGLLARAGVRSQVVRAAPHADMFSLARPLDDVELALVQAESRAVYEAFLRVVADGRGRSVDAIEAVAGGRVWGAQDALDHGLIDRIGYLETALDELRGLVEDVPERLRARLKHRVRPPDMKPAPEAPAPGASTSRVGMGHPWTAHPWIDRAGERVSPEWAVLSAFHPERDRVLCCSLAAMRICPE